LQSIYDSILAGADFGEMARIYSEDNSASQGGDLGWFPHGQMVKEFNDLSFSMKEGDISEPFRTSFGWHIIKHYGYRTDREVPRGETEETDVEKAHVAHILIKTNSSQATKDAMVERLTTFSSRAEEIGFGPAAEEGGFEVWDASPFTRNTSIQYLGRHAQAISFAFENEPGSVSDVMENRQAYLVVHVDEHLAHGLLSLEDALPDAKLLVIRDKVQARCVTMAEQIVADVQKGAKLQNAANVYNADYERTNFVNRLTTLPAFRNDPYIIGAAFGLSEIGQVSAPIAHDNGAAVVELLDREPPDLSEFNEKRDSIYSELLFYKQQLLYSDWFQNLIENSEIENNIAILEAEDGQS
jgi:parvulin-like peptidyl-prolyl isomerase